MLHMDEHLDNDHQGIDWIAVTLITVFGAGILISFAAIIAWVNGASPWFGVAGAIGWVLAAIAPFALIALTPDREP